MSEIADLAAFRERRKAPEAPEDGPYSVGVRCPSGHWHQIDLGQLWGLLQTALENPWRTIELKLDCQLQAVLSDWALNRAATESSESPEEDLGGDPEGAA